MTRFLLRRLLTGLLGLAVFASLMFFLSDWLVPGDFATNFGGGNLTEIREALGLDRPVVVRWWEWMGHLATGSLGTSYGGGAVVDVVMSVMPWSVTLFALAVTIGIAVGIPLGRRAGFRDRPLSPTLLAAATASSIFPPWLALLIVNVVLTLVGVQFYDTLRNLDEFMWDTPPFPNTVLWLVVAGLLAAGLLLVAVTRLSRLGRRRWLVWASWLLVPAGVVGFWATQEILPRIVDLLGFISLPLLALSMTVAGDVILVVAAAMAGSSTAAYTHTARAKGLTTAMIRRRHAGRATLLPAISRLAAGLPYALGGLVIIESAFSGGIGVFNPLGIRSFDFIGLSSVIFYQGFQMRDTPVSIGALIAIGVLALVVRLIVDVVHVALDPRVEAEAGVG
jgi:peptide/nickel transport system permease protein